MVQQADVRLNHRDHVVDSVHLHPTLAALERHGADDHAVGQLVTIVSSSITTGLKARNSAFLEGFQDLLLLTETCCH